MLFSDIVDEAMRELGDERWSRNDIIAPGLSGLSVRAVLMSGAPWCPPVFDSGVRARISPFFLLPRTPPAFSIGFQFSVFAISISSA